MPPKKKCTREALIQGTLDFWRKRGTAEWNARSLAAEMGISTQPIFSSFSSMEELKEEGVKAAQELFSVQLREEIESQMWPDYKAIGMAYIHFAKKEPRLFSLLYLQDQSEENRLMGQAFFDETVNALEKRLGVEHAEAERIHFAVWSCTYGLSTMLATGFCPLDDDVVSETLTSVYQGVAKGVKK